MIQLFTNPILFLNRNLLSTLFIRYKGYSYLRPVFIGLLTTSFTLIRSIGVITTISLMYSMRNLINLPLAEVYNQLNRFGNIGILLRNLISQNSSIVNYWSQCIQNNAFGKVYNLMLFLTLFGCFGSAFRFLSKMFFIVFIGSLGFVWTSIGDIIPGVISLGNAWIVYCDDLFHRLVPRKEVINEVKNKVSSIFDIQLSRRDYATKPSWFTNTLTAVSV